MNKKEYLMKELERLRKQQGEFTHSVIHVLQLLDTDVPPRHVGSGGRVLGPPLQLTDRTEVSSCLSSWLSCFQVSS